MKRLTNILSQIGLVSASLFTIWEPVIPGRAKGYVVGGLASIQAILAIIAHNSNPDGTPATVAYKPETIVK